MVSELPWFESSVPICLSNLFFDVIYLPRSVPLESVLWSLYSGVCTPVIWDLYFPQIKNHIFRIVTGVTGGTSTTEASIHGHCHKTSFWWVWKFESVDMNNWNMAKCLQRPTKDHFVMKSSWRRKMWHLHFSLCSVNIDGRRPGANRYGNRSDMIFSYVSFEAGDQKSWI